MMPDICNPMGEQVSTQDGSVCHSLMAGEIALCPVLEEFIVQRRIRL